jgi:hypothetical protein
MIVVENGAQGGNHFFLSIIISDARVDVGVPRYSSLALSGSQDPYIYIETRLRTLDDQR